MKNLWPLPVVSKQHFFWFGLLFLCLQSSTGFAQEEHVYTPGLGLGGGLFIVNNSPAPTLQIDFGIGYEVKKPTGTVSGALFRLDFLAGAIGDELDVVRVDFAPMATFGAGFELFQPYVRAGIGPLVSITGAKRSSALGIGAHGEVAVGVKGVLELYVDARAGYDPLQTTVGVTGGLRMTSFIWTEIVLEVLGAILR